MAETYAFPKDPLRGVKEADLHKAYEQCERLVFHCCVIPDRLRYLLDCVDPEQAVHLQGGVDEAAQLWMKARDEVKDYWPPFRQNVGLILERANTRSDSRVTISLFAHLQTFPTAHHAALRLGQGLLYSLNYIDEATAKECLSLPEGRRQAREYLAGLPALDLQWWKSALSLEWRNACEFMGGGKRSLGGAATKELTSDEHVRLLKIVWGKYRGTDKALKKTANELFDRHGIRSKRDGRISERTIERRLKELGESDNA